MVGGYATNLHGYQRDTGDVNMKGLEGYSFDECLNMASVADIDGVKVPFLHINQPIANKKAVNRPKDQVDVIELERIQKILGAPSP
jgi:hypothetical protein